MFFEFGFGKKNKAPQWAVTMQGDITNIITQLDGLNTDELTVIHDIEEVSDALTGLQTSVLNSLNQLTGNITTLLGDETDSTAIEQAISDTVNQIQTEVAKLIPGS
jgi:hypothetical protein